MPRYAYVCKKKHAFDELFLSFSSAEAAEAKPGSVRCPDCGSPAERDTSPDTAMAGGAFRKYGLYTY